MRLPCHPNDVQPFRNGHTRRRDSPAVSLVFCSPGIKQDEEMTRARISRATRLKVERSEKYAHLVRVVADRGRFRPCVKNERRFSPLAKVCVQVCTCSVNGGAPCTLTRTSCWIWNGRRVEAPGV